MKKTSTLFVLLFACLSVSAQWAYNWSATYQHTAAPTYSNEGRKVVTDANGNVFVLSDVTSNLDTINHPVSQTQYYVVLLKYDFTGSLLVTKLISVKNMAIVSNGYRSGFGLEVDASGNIYVGYSRYNTANNYDVEIAKYSNALSLLWTYSYTTPGNESGVDMTVNLGSVYAVVKTVNGANTTYSLIKASGNGIATAPVFSFDVNVDVVNAITFSGRNMYVTGYRLVSSYQQAMTASVTIGNLGTGLVYKKMFNNNTPTGNDWGSDIMMGGDGNIYVVGTTYTSASSGNDGMILKYNNFGIQQGMLTLNQGSLADIGGKIAYGNAGTIYASCSNATSVAIYKVNLSPFSITISASYSPTPTVPFTAVTSVSVNDMRVAASGNVYITGGANGTSASGNFCAGYLAKFGYNGFVYRKLNSQDALGDFTSSFDGVSVAIDPTHSNNIIWVRSNWRNYNTHNTENVYIDGFASGGVLRMADNETNQDGIAAGFSFYPNPAHGIMYFTSTQKILRVELCDITGKLINSSIPQMDNSIDISGFTSGVYFARVIGEEGSLVRKFIVE